MRPVGDEPQMPASPVAPGFTPRALLPPVCGHDLARCNEMLAASQPRSGLPQPRRLRETLLVSAVVIGIAAAGLVFLYLVTQGLFTGRSSVRFVFPKLLRSIAGILVSANSNRCDVHL